MKIKQKIKNYFIKRVMRAVVKQGIHRARIIYFLKLFVHDYRYEYNEDNKPTGDAYLKECLDEALKSPFPKSKYEK